MRITKFLIILAIFFLILAVTRTTSAQEESTQSTQNTRNTESTFSLLPGVSTYARSGFGLYRSSACPCFDRQTWNLDLGANLSWHRFASFEAEYRYGTMLLGGNFPTSGYAIGLRTALTPQTHRWWNTLYLRGGVGWLSTMGTRDSPYTGVYLHPGWSYALFPILHLETELSTAYYFGPMEHLNIGFRTGLRFGF